MIKAKHHKVIYPLFKGLTKFFIRRSFSSVHFEGLFKDNEHAVLVLANHISWWDGFWIMLLNIKKLNRRFYFMMLEEQLRKHWYFRYTGGFSIRKQHRSVLSSLQYAIDVLDNEQNMLLMFPQGHINSMYNDKMSFEKGIDYILKHLAPHTQLLFVANFVDYLSDKKPALSMYFKAYEVAELKGGIVENAYQEFYNSSLQLQQEKIS